MAELTAVTEAALIRYFQPEYNKTFKYNFPEPLHKTYCNLYRLDYNAVGLDFESLTTIGMRLWSDVVAPTFIHAGVFPMHRAEDRRRFFDVWDTGDATETLYIKRGEKPADND